MSLLTERKLFGNSSLTKTHHSLKTEGGSSMRVTQANRIRMFKAANLILHENQTVWSGMAPFVTAAQQFTDKIAEIDLTAQKQDTATAGATLDRATARDALEDVLFLASEALGVLA